MDLPTLIRSLNPAKGHIHPALYEAYCNSSGYLDAPYLNHVCDGRKFSQSGLNSQVNTILGTAAFLRGDDAECDEVTLAEFLEEYEFSKMPVVRDYIMFFYTEKGKLLTQKNLFSWVLNN